MALDVEKFNKFLDEIDECAKSSGFESESITSETGPDCWFGYFSDGVSAEEAFAEDMSYA